VYDALLQGQEDENQVTRRSLFAQIMPAAWTPKWLRVVGSKWTKFATEANSWIKDVGRTSPASPDAKKRIKSGWPNVKKRFESLDSEIEKL